MKKIFFALIIVLPALVQGQTKWQQTAASVSFGIKNRGSNVPGHFGAITTQLVFSPDKLASSSLKGSLKVSTINTNNQKRDKDLQDEKYFNAASHPVIQVASTKLAKQGAGYVGTFKVMIKGVTKQMQIPFTFKESSNNAEFAASFTLNRRDFGVGTKGGLALFMSDDVHVTINVKAKK